MVVSHRLPLESRPAALAPAFPQRSPPIQLPIMDGYEVTRQIKADPALRSIPIIAITSHALNGEEQTARAAGCDDYVPEPYSPRHLLAHAPLGRDRLLRRICRLKTRTSFEQHDRCLSPGRRSAEETGGLARSEVAIGYS
jgi:DNA-binding response OmpR family regulator